MEQFANLESFEWDKGNLTKNWEKHRVTPWECEQIFFNIPLVVADDAAHSSGEPRYYVLGHTDAGRRLFLVFTVRKRQIRVISARDMSPKERRAYREETQKKTDVRE
ncbi:MAG: BrnT family toxin [Nitrospira sp.]|nr:BrnT family toxin [Fimbriimonadaceae bacterium]MBX3649204.1 BrnT family toxin [Rhodocyclaceae bacterium]MCW5788243.1 BrnT family toxin [Nitrospira sp.]